MSHSNGLIKFQDGEVWHYEYNGTCSVVVSRIYPTNKEMLSNWRNHEWKECSCGCSEKVEVWSGYGGGFMMTGVACRKCNSLDVEDVYEMMGDSITEKWVTEYLEKNLEE